MILPNMSYQEIEITFRREVSRSTPRIDEAAKRFGRMVKTTSRYPLIRTIPIRTKDKMVLNLIFMAYKRSQWDHPKLCIYSTFYYKGGLHAISIPAIKGDVHILTSHFFERYRERVVKESGLTTEQLIGHYMIKNKDMGWFPNANVFSSDYQKYEHDGACQLAARIEEGNCFAEQIGQKLYLIKTIITDDMLGDSQLEAFAELERLRINAMQR